MAIETIRLGGGGEGEAEAFKALRLHGLRNDPISFANTEEEMAIRTIDDIVAELRANIVVGVLKEGKDLVGVGGIRREAAGKMNHKGLIYGNYVRPEMRGKGIGKLIMLELEKQARETAPTALLPGFEELQLRVVEGNDPAIKLYKSVGYEEFGYAARAVRYKGDYVGEYYMHKYLTEGK